MFNYHKSFIKSVISNFSRALLTRIKYTNSRRQNVLEKQRLLWKLVNMQPPRGPKGQGVADRQRGVCISTFAEVFSLNFNTTHTKGY